MPDRLFIKDLYHRFVIDKREIDLILCHVLNVNTAGLYIYENAITEASKQNIIQLIKERIKGKPLAYIIGYKEFWNLNLKVNKHTLIPRPETELIIELILKWTEKKFSGQILDLGTGTGAIALSIANERPDSKITAVDFSNESVKVAQYNQQKYSLDNVKIFQSDWFSKIESQFDFILSNPPYVAENDPHLANLSYEPITALTAKNEGYADIEHIIKESKNHLNKKGRILLEHGYNQSPTVQQMLQENNYCEIKTHNDLSDIPRITTAQFQNIAIDKK
jgi:release factor glutamine methyltransferase